MSEKIEEELSEELAENQNGHTNKTLARIKVGISSVVYICMVFIVIYGLSDGVYNGFPGLVPYIIITVFLLMSFIRMYQSISGQIPDKKKKKKQKKYAAEEEDFEYEADEEEEIDEEE